VSQSRRDLLFGWFGGGEPATPSVEGLLANARQRAPWERPSAGTTGAVARILTFDCLVAMGTECRTCIERCPVEGAIALDGGRPRIDPERCTGCGDCVPVCPAPRPAIAVIRPQGA
jgi:ferredoxin